MYPASSLLRVTLNTASLVAPRLAGRLALAVFRTPAGRSRLRPGEAELLAEARPGRLTVKGKTVLTYQWGDGTRPVLLVHGWASRAARFAPFVTALRERGFTVVAFDAPGHGGSGGRHTDLLEYGDIIRRLDRRHGTFEAVIAHSYGVLATLVALREGVGARRVVGIAGVARYGYFVDGFCALLGLRDPANRALRVAVERFLFPGESDIWRRFDTAWQPGRTGAALLLFHDDTDDMVPVDQSRSTADAYGARARLVVTHGLGHRRILADPAVVAEATDFVAA
ncbi:alpha/beta hydrolase [Streptomyces sp. SID1121]|uniref:alpha/beta hydrolase n=1 Tax=Streptomyces sp. SID1121 TaxID=3425888 RepID=UPI00405621D1